MKKEKIIAEEILEKHGIIHKPKSEYDYHIFTETFSKYDVIQAMQEYASQFRKDEQKLDGDYDIHSTFKTKKGKKYKLVPIQQEDKISDEDIKKWAEKNQVLYEDERLQKIDISGRIEGAKAMRDGQIKTNK